MIQTANTLPRLYSLVYLDGKLVGAVSTPKVEEEKVGDIYRVKVTQDFVPIGVTKGS